jgi:hypothetical protein
MSAQLALRVVVDVLEDSSLCSTELHLVYIDCKKAFDSITHDAIFQALEYYGVGPHFVQLIHRLYEGGHSDVFINGEAGTPFPISQGVHQGDTLSPPLFIITINPMLNWVATRPSGYHFTNNLCTPIIAYCNNLMLLANCASNMTVIFSQLLQFSKWTGLEFNPTKSTYTSTQASVCASLQVPVVNGSPSHMDIVYLPNSKSYKYMGVWVNLHLQWSDHTVYMRKKVIAHLNLERNRRLTMDNQIYLTNMVLNAHVAYGMCVIPYAYDWLENVQTMVLQTLKGSMGIPSNADNDLQ